MRKVFKLLAVVLTVVLVPAAIAGALYGFVYWKVTKSADDFALQISPFAEMKYEKVFIDPIATVVGLDGISLAPVGSSGDIFAESIRLKAPSWGYFLDFEEQVNNGVLPESFDISLKGLIVDLQSGYMQDWANQAASLQTGQSGSMQSYDALACGEREYFSLTDLKKMRYSSLSSDISLLYYFDRSDQVLNFDFDSSTGLMMNVSMELEIGVATDELNVQTLMFAQPQLNNVELRYRDRGYNKRRINFCTAETGVSEEQYRENYRQALFEQLTLQGWIIPEGIFNAFDKMNDPGGSGYIRLDIPQGFGAQTMMTIQKPSDFLAVLNPYVEFGGKPILLDGISWEPPTAEMIQQARKARTGETPAAEMVASEDDVKQDDSADSGAPRTEEEEKNINLADLKEKRQTYTKKQQVSFKDVSLASLKQHIGKQIQLRTYFGRLIEGELIAVSASEVKVEHRLVDGRGTAIYPIAKNKIENVKLYH